MRLLLIPSRNYDSLLKNDDLCIQSRDFVATWNDGLWQYSTTFDTASLQAGAEAAPQTLLVFDGIRMGAMVALNGHPLGNATDQFIRYIYPVGSLLKPAGGLNTLTVTFGASLGIDCEGRWTRSNMIDWAPVMPTTDAFQKRSTFGFGIWKSVYLLPMGDAAITQLVSHTYYAGGHPTIFLTDKTHKGFDVNVTAELYLATAATTGTLTVLGSWPGAHAVSSKLIAGASHATVTLPAAQTLQARLWQPNGYGEQVRYDLTATFTPDGVSQWGAAAATAAAAAAAVASRKIGFRSDLY